MSLHRQCLDSVQLGPDNSNNLITFVLESCLSKFLLDAHQLVPGQLLVFLGQCSWEWVVPRSIWVPCDHIHVLFFLARNLLKQREAQLEIWVIQLRGMLQKNSSTLNCLSGVSTSLCLKIYVFFFHETSSTWLGVDFGRS